MHAQLNTWFKNVTSMFDHCPNWKIHLVKCNEFHWLCQWVFLTRIVCSMTSVHTHLCNSRFDNTHQMPKVFVWRKKLVVQSCWHASCLCVVFLCDLWTMQLWRVRCPGNCVTIGQCFHGWFHLVSCSPTIDMCWKCQNDWFWCFTKDSTKEVTIMLQSRATAVVLHCHHL